MISKVQLQDYKNHLEQCSKIDYYVIDVNDWTLDENVRRNHLDILNKLQSTDDVFQYMEKMMMDVLYHYTIIDRKIFDFAELSFNVKLFCDKSIGDIRNGENHRYFSKVYIKPVFCIFTNDWYYLDEYLKNDGFIVDYHQFYDGLIARGFKVLPDFDEKKEIKM